MTSLAETSYHSAWLGYLQPVGLVVSVPALDALQVVPSENEARLKQPDLEETVEEFTVGDQPDPQAVLKSLPLFFEQVLGWEISEDLAGHDQGPEE